MAYLEENGELVAAAATDGRRAGLPARARSTDDLIESVLAAEEPSLARPRCAGRGRRWARWRPPGRSRARTFDDEAEELMGSVAASAATAVATAQSVAADRLRHEIEASEEARARWARELHDETLQGLVGLRMLLASARRSALARATSDEAVSDALEQTAARDPEPAQPDRRAAARRRSTSSASTRPSRRSRSGAPRTAGSRSRRGSICANGGRRAARAARPRRPSTGWSRRRSATPPAIRAARVVRVEVAERDDAIDVRVADNGRGFDPAPPAGGFGLRGMRERVAARRRLDDDRLLAGRLRGAGAPAHARRAAVSFVGSRRHRGPRPRPSPSRRRRRRPARCARPTARTRGCRPGHRPARPPGGSGTG